MKYFLVIVAFGLIPFGAQSAELALPVLELPKIFENGEVADADDFNANFDYLKGVIAGHLDDVAKNAPWLNRGYAGIAKELEVDCNQNPDALRVAYLANIHERHLGIKIAGTCFGAIGFIEEVDPEGQVFWSEVQPMNQVLSIYSGGGYVGGDSERPRPKLIPRTMGDISKVGLVSSFGNGLYLNYLDIEMGADDFWAVLYSRNSNGGLQDVTVTGHPEGVAGQIGVLVQFGASAYLQATIAGVDYGIYGNKAGSIRTFFSDVSASSSAIEMDGGELYLHSTVMTAPAALILNGGAQAKGTLSPLSLNGDLSVNSGSLAKLRNLSITGSISLDTAIVELSGDGIPADILTKVSCSGLSELQIQGQNINNNNGNHCLDKAAWNSLINAAFPVN